jgi:hypothetical protein
MSFDRFYSPADAAQLLVDAGFPLSKNYLAKLRCLGGGPRFHKFGSRVLYRQPDLMEWAESRLSDSMANTADAGVAG